MTASARVAGPVDVCPVVAFQARRTTTVASSTAYPRTTELAFAANDAEQQQLAVLVSNELKKIGVTVTLSPLDPATFADRRGKKTVPFQITY